MRRQRLLAALAAVALLAIESVALAHEIEHDLGRHDEPSCALHLFASGLGKTVAAEPCLPDASTPTSFDVIPAIPLHDTSPILGYHGRAPPLAVPVAG